MFLLASGYCIASQFNNHTSDGEWVCGFGALLAPASALLGFVYFTWLRFVQYQSEYIQIRDTIQTDFASFNRCLDIYSELNLEYYGKPFADMDKLNKVASDGIIYIAVFGAALPLAFYLIICGMCYGKLCPCIGDKKEVEVAEKAGDTRKEKF